MSFEILSGKLIFLAVGEFARDVWQVSAHRWREFWSSVVKMWNRAGVPSGGSVERGRFS